MNINPDQYIKHCAKLLGNRNRSSKGSLRIDQIYTGMQKPLLIQFFITIKKKINEFSKNKKEIDERSKPFKTLNETIVQEIKLKEVELGLDSRIQEKKRSTPSGKLKAIERLEDKEISKLL